MRKPTFFSTKYRAVLAGNELEFKYFEEPLYYGFSTNRKSVIRYDEPSEESRLRSRYRAVKRIRDLVNANFGEWKDQFERPAISKFLTLTFRDNYLLPEESNPEFKLFIKRLNYRIFKTKKSLIQYIATIEFQKESKKLHYHIVLFNLPFIDNFHTVFEEEWGLGYVWIEKVPNKNVGQYITKYMTKSDDEKLRGQMSYLRSQGLIEPTVMLDEKFLEELYRSMPFEAQTFAMPYMSDYRGLTEIKKFSLANFPDIKKRILANIPKTDKFKAIP
jgi:hypothetical protein